MSERIICSAVWYKEIEINKLIPSNVLPINVTTGLIFCGYRHSHCIYTKVSITGLRDAETSKNRFVSREEALIIALRENQVINLKEVRGDRLFSEDLY